MKIQSVVSKFRMFGLGLALSLTIAAFATTPASAAPGVICETGCWEWDAQNGCTQEVTCCANSNGDWFCILW